MADLNSVVRHCRVGPAGVGLRGKVLPEASENRRFGVKLLRLPPLTPSPSPSSRGEGGSGVRVAMNLDLYCLRHPTPPPLPFTDVVDRSSNSGVQVILIVLGPIPAGWSGSAQLEESLRHPQDPPSVKQCFFCRSFPLPWTGRRRPTYFHIPHEEDHPEPSPGPPGWWWGGCPDSSASRLLRL